MMLKVSWFCCAKQGRRRQIRGIRLRGRNLRYLHAKFKSYSIVRDHLLGQSGGNLQSSISTTLKLDPRMAEAYANRGLALMVLGREAEARTDLEKCVELRPELKSDLERRIGLARKLMVQTGGVVSNN